MKKIRLTIYTLALIFLFVACENEKFYYKDEARVRIEGPYEWSLGNDSLNFSFATYKSSVIDYTMEMTLYVMGEAIDADREASLMLDASKTTATTSQYSFPEKVVIPSGKLSATFPVVLKRTSDLTSREVALSIKIVENDNFKVGVVEQNKFTFKWSDILSKPKNWDKELVEFFGEYSLVKYRFIIDTTGIGEFGGNMSWSELMNYKIVMKNALTQYNDAHPNAPMSDENGQLVTF